MADESAREIETLFASCKVAVGEGELRYYRPASLGKLEFDIGAKVHRILEEGSYTKGAYVDELATELATKSGYEKAIVFGAGTHAIFVLARWYKQLGYKRILCPAFTWPSTYLPFEWCGFQIKFVDIHPDTWLAEFGDLKPSSDELCIPVDTFGSAWAPTSEGWAFPFVDSAQSLGAKWSDTTPNRIISLSGSKIVTSGEGGALLTQDKELAKFAEETGAWFSRMPETSAVIGLAFLSQLSRIIEAKREIANAYQKAFPQIQWQRIPSSTNHYIVAGLMDDPMNFVMRHSNVEFRKYYTSIVSETNETQPMASLDGLPNTKDVSRRIVAFPSAPDMPLDAISTIVEP